MIEKLKELKTELARLTDAIAEIEKHCKGEHGFKNGQKYWFVKMDGVADWYKWRGDETDNRALSINNVFHTKEEAEQRLEYLKAESTLRRFMKGKPKGEWVVYGITHNGTHKCFNPCYATNRYCPDFLYSDKQTILDLITTHERELKIYFEVDND